MSELDRLIESCSSDISLMQDVKRPRLLIKYLKELRDDIIGMDTVKNDIADQTRYLIANMNKKTDTMLNTLIYGAAGQGKTSLAKKLAKIWYALGYLETPEAMANKSKNASERSPNSLGTGSISSMEILTILLIYGYLIGAYIASCCKNMYEKFGWYFIGIAVVTVIVLFYFAWPYLSSYYYKLTGVKPPTSSSSQTRSFNKQDKNNKNDDDNEAEPREDEIVKITSRVDFVAGYVGQSAIKTTDLLNKCQGKVLVVDEAYSLINGPQDSFGMESLTEFNLYLSQNAGKFAAILCGYEDQMRDGIFKEQPGLPRRFMWHFRCPGYSASELFQIFVLQAKREGFQVGTSDDERDRMVQLFNTHMSAFPSFAGDTERLVFFSQVEHNRDLFKPNMETQDKVLSYSQIQLGIDKLRENNIHSDKPKANKSRMSSRELSSLMKHLQKATESAKDNDGVSQSYTEEMVA